MWRSYIRINDDYDRMSVNNDEMSDGTNRMRRNNDKMSESMINQRE